MLLYIVSCCCASASHLSQQYPITRRDASSLVLHLSIPIVPSSPSHMCHFSISFLFSSKFLRSFFFFFFNDPAPPEFSPFPLHAALPIGGARHDSHRSLQVLEVDMTGMACGPKAAFATKGYFAHQRHRRGRQRGRVLATSDGEMVVD